MQEEGSRGSPQKEDEATQKRDDSARKLLGLRKVSQAMLVKTQQVVDRLDVDAMTK